MAESNQDGPAGAPGTGRKAWDDRLNEVGARAEEEVRRVVRFLDEEVVPEVRRNGSIALRRAATELERLARNLDDHRTVDDHRTAGGPTGKP